MEADNLALKWNKDALLVYLRDFSDENDHGFYQKWRYKYWDGKSYTQNSCIEIEVSKDYAEIIRYTNLYIENERPISNWLVNSNNAYAIGVNNYNISSWLSKYSDANTDGFSLYGAYENNTNPLWVINWHSPGFMDNPHNARIVIDATNGNIIDVETQMD